MGLTSPGLAAISNARLTLLQNLPIFSFLSSAELQKIDRAATVRPIAAGEVILREGEYGDSMYVIESGSVQIYTKSFDGADLVLARLEIGDAFGEQALLPGGSLIAASTASSENFASGSNINNAASSWPIRIAFSSGPCPFLSGISRFG